MAMDWEAFADDVTEHLNLPVDSPDSRLVLNYTLSAVGVMESWCGPTADLPETDGLPPPAIMQAVRMYAAHLYENREATTFAGAPSEMPLGFFDLIGPYRKWAFYDGEE